jgi:hypothetical protein
MAIRCETDAYRLESERNGLWYTLTRKIDGTSAFFQDDDADLWQRNMDSLESITDWKTTNTFEQSFNFLCSGYDDVMF